MQSNHTNTSTESNFRNVQIVDAQKQDKFNFAFDSLEKQLLHYITSQADSGNTIKKQFIRDLFFHARKLVK